MNGVKAGRKKEYGINWRYVERQKQQRLEIGFGGEAEAARQEQWTAGSARRTRVRDLVRRDGWNLAKTAHTSDRFLAGPHAPGRTTDQVAITMDPMPTLLAAAGVAPEQVFAPDGINLLPMLVQGGPLVARKLFWRYKANAQRAVLDGDYKFLKILDNTFLFNVVDDPMERANLKVRHTDIYNRMVAEWYEWNATTLPEIDASFTERPNAQ
jgi:hypothetical protein